jgi:hypothetical protein
MSWLSPLLSQEECRVAAKFLQEKVTVRHHMLFIRNGNGASSTAKIVRIR